MVGETVKTAAKLSTAAGPGQVLASEVTLAAVGAGFNVEAAPVALDGRASGLRAFVVKEEKPR